MIYFKTTFYNFCNKHLIPGSMKKNLLVYFALGGIYVKSFLNFDHVTF